MNIYIQIEEEYLEEFLTVVMNLDKGIVKKIEMDSLDNLTEDLDYMEQIRSEMDEEENKYLKNKKKLNKKSRKR
jgi:hypothetical protein